MKLIEFVFVWIVVKLGIWCGLAALLAFWTRHELTFWVSYVKGVPTPVGYWPAFAASLLLPITFIADVISSIARLFV